MKEQAGASWHYSGATECHFPGNLDISAFFSYELFTNKCLQPSASGVFMAFLTDACHADQTYLLHFSLWFISSPVPSRQANR
jgi:hypothetical protein